MDILCGHAVRLDALRESDFPALTGWHADGGFLRELDAAPAFPRTEARLRARMANVGPEAYFFAVRTLGDGRLAGYLGLDAILWNHGVCWLEMAIAPAEQGRGFGGEALRLALNFAFGELNLRRVQLTVFSDNARAIALYEGVGFRREGTFREFLHRDGVLTDMLLYGVLRREWRGA